MCGIAGKRTFTGEIGDRALMHAMCETIVRRGPDAEGIHAGPDIGLGQRRLAVIDTDHRSDPPLSNEDGSIWIVFNGEIYNYRPLAAELLAAGHKLRTRSDTEVIVHLYEEHGVECLAHLEGMFAFAIWDGSKKLLFAARDRFGEKPFYFHHSPTALIFGSAIRTVMRDPAIRAEPNYRAIDNYLNRQYVPSPDTAFKGIDKLPAAHYLLCDGSGRLRVCRYWSPPSPLPLRRDYSDVKTELRHRLAQSVRQRMVADVPLGALLSGGIDSGLVVALMAEAGGRPVKTFTVGFEGGDSDELPYARQVAERFATDHTEYVVSADVQHLLPDLVREYNEPFADCSAIPSYYVAQVARRTVTVALTGDGGDENFAGYDHYVTARRWGVLDAIPLAVRRTVLLPLVRATGLLPYSNAASRASRALRLLAAVQEDRFIESTAIFKREERAACYSARFLDLIGECPDRSQMNQPGYADSTEPIDWMMQHDQHHYLPDCLMVKADVASMANGLELRAPFLDHHVAEFAATIPLALKRDRKAGKRLLRNLAAEMLPFSVATKKKTGFTVPLAAWLRTSLAAQLKESLLGGRFARRGLFDPAFVRRMVEEHLRCARDWSSRLWALLWLELWFQEFID